MLKHLVANNVTYIPIDILRFDSIVDDFERAFAAWPAPTSGQMNNFNTFLRWPILAAYMKMYEARFHFTLYSLTRESRVACRLVF